MKVVVTGAAGLAGSHIVQELLDHGHEVIGTDIVGPNREDVRWETIDLTDYDSVESTLAGADAIVHMGAIPRPGSVTSSELFRINTLGTFNVFEAAAQLGISRIVQGSSMSVLGYPFFINPIAPEYVPMDENHPKYPQDPYAISKKVGEEIAEAWVRRTNSVAVSLRMVWIHTPESFAEQLAPLWDDAEAGAANLWAYVDGRDVGQACRKALTADVTGHLACFISAMNTFMKRETRELAAEFYPDSPIDSELGSHGSFFSIELAKSALGFEPEYSWESYELS